MPTKNTVARKPITDRERHRRNEAIARFLGFRKYSELGMEKPLLFAKYRNLYYLHTNPDETKRSYPATPVDELPFDSSYDWVMTTLEAIERLGYSSSLTFGMHGGEKDMHLCAISSTKILFMVVCRAQSREKLEAVWLAVSDFAINENKKNA